MTSQSRAIAFIGLGIMGAPMAENLVRAGHTVTGFNRSPQALDRLVAAGGKAASDVAGAVAGAEVVITMLPDTPDVRDVVLGESGVLAHAPRGSLLIDMSTITPSASAPVSGGEPAAIEGTLSIMVGGDEASYLAALPVLQALGKTIVHVGLSGSGQTVKAANQLIVAGNIELLAEALVFLEAHAVDTSAAVRVLGGGLAGSTVLERKATGMLARQFSPGFRLALHHKDLGIVAVAARDKGVVIPLGSLVSQLVAAMNAQGDGGLDHSALFKGVQRLSGRSD
jgi:2-hydroxy-3-oxopropionate reductase